MVKLLALTFRGRGFNPGLFQSFERNFKPRPRFRMTLAVGGTFNRNRITHFTYKDVHKLTVGVTPQLVRSIQPVLERIQYAEA